MFSNVFRVFLLLALLWQGLLLPVATGATKQATELEHIVVHAKKTAHHHHHDEGTHFGANADDVQHQHIKDCTQQVVIIFLPVDQITTLLAFQHNSYIKSELRYVYIECPFRPPKLTA
jgi:hypothetical protein